ncbi:phosphodiester glycosidase family protein [Ammoniphilus sp. YIM 78166]|uniref:phosphodiester glycosidase family protein n=1 Tax=Ammoniphilus sp. YIM 78166 TaxID=1644106 RepID=UPI00106F435D|nr:phosphodiester glycosidase family protein [Ammoniphilus sp. YIM 78166]
MELSRVKSTRRTKQKSKGKVWLLGLIVIAILAGGYFASYNARLWLAGSLLVTQHHHWAKYTLIPEKKLEELRQDMANPEMENSTTGDSPTTEAKPPTQKHAPKEPIEIIPVERKVSGVHYFKGHALIVHDPSRVHLVQTTGTKRSGKGLPRGEFISEFVERTGALAAVNASGFYDPNWMGYGETPSGLVIQDGKILSAATGKGETVVGLTFDGKLITGNYSAEQLVKEMKVRDAVSFKPQLIVNGENLFTGKEATSWGIAPRTAMGQTKEGAIIFIVIDGRQPTHSLGASMTDMANLMEEFGAVNAMALDGGTSSMMVTKEKILTSSSNDDERGRWLPNAWVVF